MSNEQTHCPLQAIYILFVHLSVYVLCFSCSYFACFNWHLCCCIWLFSKLTSMSMETDEKTMKVGAKMWLLLKNKCVSFGIIAGYLQSIQNNIMRLN